VKKFIQKGGKFLYCNNKQEVTEHLMKILAENNWNNVVCSNESLNKILSEIKSAKTSQVLLNLPFFVECEALVAEDGSIMFSTEQLGDNKLKDLPNNFIVFGKTSQLVKTISDGVMGVRMRAKKNKPTIVSSVKDYLPNKSEVDFLTYGNTNSKTLYLLLLEDL
jgi:L-lactate utilization protein LutC